MVLGLEVGQVGCTWAPIHAEHLLRFLALHPEEAHVPRLTLLALHVLVAHTLGCGVVRLDGCLALRVVHLN